MADLRLGILAGAHGEATLEPLGTPGGWILGHRAYPKLPAAINPEPVPKFFPFRPDVIDAYQFSKINETKLAQYDCVFLCDVGEIHVRVELHAARVLDVREVAPRVVVGGQLFDHGPQRAERDGVAITRPRPVEIGHGLGPPRRRNAGQAGGSNIIQKDVWQPVVVSGDPSGHE